MIYKIYCVHDVNVGYNAPVIQENDAVAMRNFENVCSDKSSVWYTHCADFSLVCIGTFNSDTAEISCTPPEKVCSASDFVIPLMNHEN